MNKVIELQDRISLNYALSRAFRLSASKYDAEKAPRFAEEDRKESIFYQQRAAAMWKTQAVNRGLLL